MYDATNGSTNNIDFDCLSAKIVDHVIDHKTNLYYHKAVQLTSSILNENRLEANKEKGVSPFQTEIFTIETLQSCLRKAWTLKSERNLPDEVALSALSLLLPTTAYKWWENTRPHVKQWTLAVALMLKVLDVNRTLSSAWREFEDSQHQFDKNLKPFLSEQRILLAEIRQYFFNLTEDMEIDLIYHKINPTVQKNVDRRKIKSFDDLIELAEAVDFENLDPDLDDCKCTNCKRSGHSIDKCLDKKFQTQKQDDEKRYRSSSIPSIPIKINGIPDYVHLATDSHINVITDQLYLKLVQRGCVFETSKQMVATIRSNRKHVLHMTTCFVECNGYLTITPVVKLQNSRGIKNCFGMSFIEACDLFTYIGYG